MQREWERPHFDEDSQFTILSGKSSQRVLVVILFWTLFEHLMDQFFRTAVSSLPRGVGAELLNRHQSIGSRMDRLYNVLFDTKLSADLEVMNLGRIYAHLKRIQDRRNDYIHGNAEAIDDELVKETVERLNDVQAAWVALFNKRCTGNPNATPIWLDAKARTSSGPKA